MGSVIVCGAGVIGLAAAAMLARDGHQVTVLEADPDGAPDAAGPAWESWRRGGVAQFRQPHNLFARFRQVCDAELPGLTDRMLAAGCVWGDYLDSLPPTLDDPTSRPGDAALRFVTGRRPVVESVIAGYAQDQPGVSVRRGVKVAALLPGRSATPGVPHVAGVRTADGTEIRADLVVDAMGRRTPAPALLAALGARPPVVESGDSGFVYHTRYFTGPALPRRIGPAIYPHGSISVLTLDGDNDTWSVTVFGETRDAPLKALRDPVRFDRVVRACPLQAHWLDGSPITGVVSMAGVLDQHRRYIVDDLPVATGFAAVGDAWACTNPSAGRGLSVGAVHAQVLRDAVRAHLDRPADLPVAFDEYTERLVGPFYRNQLAADRARHAEMAAARDRTKPPPPDPDLADFVAAGGHDAEVFRGLIECVQCVSFPQDVLARPGMRDRIGKWRGETPQPIPGPDRTRLLELLAA